MPTKSRRQWKRWADRAFACTLVLSACDGRRAGANTAGIELTPSIELRGSGDTVDIILASRPYIAASGDVVVAPVAATRGHFAAYDSTGRLYKVFGQAGRGPGEVSVFQGHPMLSGFGFGPGDTLLIGDRTQLRIHVLLPPPALTLLRETKVARRALQFEVTPHGLYEPPSKMAPSLRKGGRARVVTPGGVIGTPPRLGRFDGTQLAEFGEYTEGAADYDVFGRGTVVDADHIWFSYSNRYELELRGSDGKTVRTLKRNAEWFPVDTSPNRSVFERPPPPRIQEITVGPDGNLWVLVRKANRDWAKARPATPPVLKPGMPIALMPSISMADYYECVLEVLSPDKGKLLASRELPGDYVGFVGGDRIYQLAEDSTGTMTIRVFRMGLTGGRN